MASATHPARIAELYTRYSEELLGFIRSMMPISKVDANDLLQKIFVELLGWAERNPEVPIEHPRGFVYQVARRHVLKHRARLIRTPTHRAEDSVALQDVLVTHEDDDLELLATMSQERRSLLRAMRRLDGELQLVVYLRHWAGMTEAELGRMLDLERGAVRRRQRKALGQLREQLEWLEAREPNTTRTPTELLRRWWHRLEQEARRERASLDPEDPGGGGTGRPPP